MLKQPHILIVEDDAYISDLIALYLTKYAYTYLIAEDGAQALELLYAQPPDLVLLDIMLPKVDGWGVCAEIRKNSDVPIIMVTGSGESYDKLKGFAGGVDEYIVKPFDPKELIARIQAVLRRANPVFFKPSLQYTGLLIQAADNRIITDAGEVMLAPKEMELLHVLASNPNKVFTREQLLVQVWGADYPNDFRTVDVHIKRIREKIGYSAHWNMATVWGVGYKFEVMR
ncbi:response regulator transcription factor [Paenibacillus sp. ACRRX]|uniref:response regulator transcription factor n=1 Tax=Paenibacillus sp. ACRRX TaxID=2918206 RepID=UPI001EF608C0|nr:response regulator transcription factor [Paenibacillus sp. ACRRX]MCG7408594.1 response regulator transcription factor [Paenibacillus sp. ACRRX]